MSEPPYPRDLVGYGRNPPDPRWPARARIALQFVVNYEEGGVAASGIDLVYVESPGRPGRERLPDLLCKGGCCQKADEARQNSHVPSVYRGGSVAVGQ